MPEPGRPNAELLAEIQKVAG